MKSSLNLLMVDDHPMMVDAYVNIISSSIDDYTFNFIKANDSESAYKLIEKISTTKKTIEIALLDISLPPYEKRNIFCGGDLAKIVRSKFPNCKIIMITHHSEGLIVDTIYKNIKPEGFLNKVDINFDTFSEVLKAILNNKTYISETIRKSIENLNKRNINWDTIDSLIVDLLEKGIRTKDMPNYIDLSLSAIEKRKATIKFNIIGEKTTDKELIKTLKKLNLS